MFDNKSGGAEESFKLLEELELNAPKGSGKGQAGTDRETRATVYADPGNIRERAGRRGTGMTSRVSKTELTATFDSPLIVGDIYLLSFDRDELDASPVYAQCRRCRLVTDDTFEATCATFSAIEV